MKIILLTILCCICVNAQKIKSIKKTISMEEALQHSGMDAQEFINKYKGIVSHQFKKDINDKNYFLLRSFLRGIQDKKLKESDEIIISVIPSSDFNSIKFNMYMMDHLKNKVVHRKVNIKYQVLPSGPNEIKTQIIFDHFPGTEFAVRTLGAAKYYAVPSYELLTLKYDEITNSLTYEVVIELLDERSLEIVDQAFNTIFTRLKDIAKNDLVPMINAIED